MRIYIDISVLLLATFVTGIQRVTREIAVRLIAMEDAEIVLLHYYANKDLYYRIDNHAFCNFYLYNKGRKEKMVTRQIVKLQEIGRGSVFFDLDAVWMSRVKRSYLLPILKEQGARIVAHIYDIISITHPQYCLQRGVYNFMDYVGAHLLYADNIIVNAHATVAELEKLAKETDIKLQPCQVVSLGADYGYGNKGKAIDSLSADNQETNKSTWIMPSTELAVAKEKPYILMVGTIEPRKNHKLLLEAYEKGLKDMGYHIIIAGYMGWNMEVFAEELKCHPDYQKGIFHFEGLKDADISYLYQHARFLAFCSYTEGFGLPIIESIMRGTPVLAADVPVLREVGGDYCVYFRQDDSNDLCQLVKHYMDNEREYRKLIAKLEEYVPTSWEESAEGMKRVLVTEN